MRIGVMVTKRKGCPPELSIAPADSERGCRRFLKQEGANERVLGFAWGVDIRRHHFRLWNFLKALAELEGMLEAMEWLFTYVYNQGVKAEPMERMLDLTVLEREAKNEPARRVLVRALQASELCEVLNRRLLQPIFQLGVNKRSRGESGASSGQLLLIP
ncbi:MAG: hypothetical protein Q7N87_03155 [Candidatus Uhrbacteria bacterium]|nr:hypothetical protein [Candidatus Uhrbacteria bacterium]